MPARNDRQKPTATSVASLETPLKQVLLAIEELYTVFAPYRAPSRLHASPIVDAEAMHAALLSAPLRQLAGAQLCDYAARALTTVGSDRDYRYFLPRILELCLVDGNELFSVGILGGKLALARWRDWSADEIRAIERVFDLGWVFVLTRRPGMADAADWLLGRGRASLPAEPALATWLLATSPCAWCHLAELIHRIRPSLLKSGTIGAWHEAGVDEDFVTAVTSWLLRSDDLGSRLYAAALADSVLDDWDRERMADAADRLAEMRQALAR